jgi:hypothetical protein
VGPRHAQTLIFLEQVAISTTILTKEYVAVGGELQGENRIGLKPLFPAPAIAYFCKLTAKVHMKEGALEKRASA